MLHGPYGARVRAIEHNSHRRGRLELVYWQGLEANEWLLVLGLAAADLVAPPAAFGEAGQEMFSLSDRESLARLLTNSGFGQFRGVALVVGAWLVIAVSTRRGPKASHAW